MCLLYPSGTRGMSDASGWTTRYRRRPSLRLGRGFVPAVQWRDPGAPPIDASTDPCEVNPPTVDPSTGAVTSTVLGTQASIWGFGVKSGLVVTTSSPPNATSGLPYGPVALQAVGGTSTSPYVTTLKWKKVPLPKGLKLSSAGVLSGTPSAKLHAGFFSVIVQVRRR